MSLDRNSLRHAGVALLALAVVLLPFLIARQHLDLMVFAGIYTIAGLGVGLLLGQCGIVNLAQAFFYGVGAYSSAYLTVNHGLTPLAGIVVGVMVSAILALAIGWPILRLTGFFLALATLAIGLIGNILFYEWDWLTGGTLGIGGLPALSLLEYSLNTPTRFYYFVWALVLLLLLLARNLVHGRPGLAMQAMRDAAPAAESLAIDMHRLKTQMFVLSAILGSIAGSLFAHFATYVSVQSFTAERSIIFLLIPVIAGATSIWGIVLGALFVTVLPELLSGLGEAHQMLFGLALVVVVTLLPQGLSGIPARLRKGLKA
ncbi:branched-chain amino acid ABC transporter permease [Ensifer adhaerens]|uniref:branched-chain amino acid ABC transporter permease n=1 Tax=Ensifer adhaerens TaxID=106592 RepID=UPI000FDBC848|nr:branched-chain amino acid ABC transporter permease [Ensifer adhaerens]MDF8357667.1 branched-chain amino acid ABC transporter permease [Ensifer adhaerens]THA60189.1 branched-chain amino acid ABC transporter permease [Ensifer adhaerens]